MTRNALVSFCEAHKIVLEAWAPLVRGERFDHPVIVHIAKSENVDDWATSISGDARLLADKFWPGPLTLVLPRRTQVHDVVTGGLETIGLRVPSHPVFAAVLLGLVQLRVRP